MAIRRRPTAVAGKGPAVQRRLCRNPDRVGVLTSSTDALNGCYFLAEEAPARSHRYNAVDERYGFP